MSFDRSDPQPDANPNPDSGALSIPDQPAVLASQVPTLYANEDELKAQLEDCLVNIQGSGSFAIFESVSTSNPPNPGLYLNNGGLIGLPLSDRDVQVIVQASHAAPFGKGEETIVDPTVRKTWEISASDFELRNPAWNKFVEEVASKVSKGLGVDSTGKGVTAELYKMLLYDEGAMFKPHQDSEKAHRMFATLVIALPCKHEGGEVHVTHNGKTKIFETAKYSEFDYSYMAWFSDVTHEVKPVTSGHRLVLTYNLIHTTLGPKELAANSNKSMSRLKSILPLWKTTLDHKPRFEPFMGFLLEHQYTEACLRYDGLKGNDHEVAAHLRQVCEELEFSLYLANLERSIEGGCDEDDWGGGDYHAITEEVDRSTTLKKVVELDGTEVAQDVVFDDEYIIQRAAFDEDPPDDEDYSGFTGNEGVSATHFYRRTVLVIIPKNRRMELFFPNPSPDRSSYMYWRSDPKPDGEKMLKAWIECASDALAQNVEDKTAREDLEQLCQLVIHRMKAWKSLPPPTHSYNARKAPFSDEVVDDLVVKAVQLNNESMFLEAYGLCCHRANLGIFEAAGTALVRWDLISILPRLKPQLATIPSISAFFDATEELRIGFEQEGNCDTRKFFGDWIEEQEDYALKAGQIAVEFASDGSTLVSLAKKLEDPQEILTKILPVAKNNVHNTPMAVAFLTDLIKADAKEEIPRDIARSIFHDIIADLADRWSLSQLGEQAKAAAAAASLTKRQATGYLSSIARIEPVNVPNVPVDIANSQNIANLLCSCQALGFTSELSQMINKMTIEAQTVPIELFESTYLPFLRTLAPLLKSQNLPIEIFQPLFQSLLSTYITRFVQTEPQQPKDWVRPTARCNCQDCQVLNTFLRNPTERVCRIAVNQKRRGHLHSQVGGMDLNHETERRGSPQTLVITKTLGNLAATKKKWKERCDVARKEIGEFGDGVLKEFLGSSYENVKGLNVRALISKAGVNNSAVRNQGQLSTAGGLTSTSNSGNRGPLPPVTKRKVPQKVIVIDDSDTD